MKKFPKFATILVLIILFIGTEAYQISNQRIGIQSYMEQSGEQSPIEAALEPPKKPYSLNTTVRELIKATPYPANETDTDNDTLPDSVERVIGTGFNKTDTDFDGLNDSFEIYNGLDPLEPDSNLDGFPDYLEVTYHGITNASLDIDNDGIPNAWDFDNDGDGVIDRLDDSPNAKSEVASKFSFNLTTDGQPLYMTFQLRPKDPSHLTLVDQSWDWPWDNESTMQDLDNSLRDLIIIPWLRLTCSANALPNQSAVIDYGMLMSSDSMEVSLSPNREFGTVVAFTGSIFHPAPPGNFSFDLELLWKVFGLSDMPVKALDAGAGIYLTTGSDGRIVANTTDETQGMLQWIDLGENKVALKVPSGGYISMASDGTLFANGTSVGDQESFIVSYQGGNKIGLKAANGKYLAVYDKVVVANSTNLIEFNLVDLDYYPQVKELVNYKEDFLLTGFSIEESYGSELGLFYSDNMTQIIAANMLLDYVFLRNNLANIINAIPPLENMSAILAAYNVTINVKIESFVDRYQAFMQTGIRLIPEVLKSLPNNLTLPIIICNEERSKLVELSDTLTGTDIMGNSKGINLTAVPLITLKTMRTSFYNTSSLEILTLEEVMTEIIGWNFEPNSTALLMTMFWKWTSGESVITQKDDLPTDFFDYIPSFVLAGTTVHALIVLGWDIFVTTLLMATVDYILTQIVWIHAVNNVLDHIKCVGGMSKLEYLGETGEKAAINYVRDSWKALKTSTFKGSFKWLKLVGKALCVIDIIFNIYFYFQSMKTAYDTAEAYAEVLDEGFGEEYYWTYQVVAALMYSLFAVLTVVLLIVSIATGLIILFGILLAIVSFFLDFFIGALVGAILGNVNDEFHAEPDITMEGAPEMTIYDKDNNGLDVGDRIEILAHLVGSIKGAGNDPNLQDWSYIVPWISINASGSGSLTSPNLEASFTESDWNDTSRGLKQTPYLNLTSSTSIDPTLREDQYNSSAWIEPGLAMPNFPIRIQVNSRYNLRQIWYHKILGLFKCWHYDWNANKTEGSPLTTLYYDVLPGSLDSFLTWSAIDVNDHDGDGLNDTAEVAGGITDESRFDTDADGLNDKYELDIRTNPRNCDTDEDGLNDKYEFLYGTNATNRDSDGDGLYDYIELAGWVISFNYSGQLFSMPVVSNPALNDTDGDGLSDGVEYWNGFNPRSTDTNGDGIDDVASPVQEIIVLLQNITDIQQLTFKIFNESCSISELAVDGDGSVYAPVIRPGIIDSVLVLDSNLTCSNNWTLSFKSGFVAVDRANEFVYVEDIYQREHYYGRHVRFNLTGTNPVVKNLAYSEGACEGLDIDSAGFIYTTQHDPICYSRFYPNGSYIESYGSSGSNPWQFRQISSIAADAKYGFVYVLDKNDVIGQERIMKFNMADGTYITSLPNGYQHIMDLTVDSEGWVYVLDQFDPVLGEGCVRRFNYLGMEDRNFILTDINNTYPWKLVHNPIRIEIDSAKNIYILENATPEYPNPRILKFSWNTTSEPLQIPNTIYEWDGDTLGNIFEDVIGWNVTFRNNGTLTTLHVTSEPLLRDTDFDGFSDYEENRSRTNPRNPDTDGDGLSDLDEWLLGTNLTDDDTDNDGLSDSKELLISSNPFNESDTDHDKLTDLVEFNLGSNPTETDTDFDGANDSREVTYKSNFLMSDTDGDFLFDGLEYQFGTNASDPDTDDDGLFDGDELIYYTDPLRNDTDWDGAIDGLEVDLGLNPRDNDTDSDGLRDYIELEWGINPFNKDTDYDGIEDAYDPDTMFSFPAPIVLVFDLDPLNNTAKFAQALNQRANVTIVSLEAFTANYTTAPYIVLVGKPAMQNNTVEGLIYELMADTGGELTEMMANDSHKIVARYGVWTSQQTVVMMSEAYPFDVLNVFNLIKEKNVTIQADSISAEYLTTPIIHSEHYYFGFALNGIDMVKRTNSEITITYDNWARPEVNVTRYDVSNTPHTLETGKGLMPGEGALDIYLQLVVIANNSIVENVNSALIKIYYRFADLDRNSDGYLTDPSDIDENQLTLYYYDEATGLWQKLIADLDWVLEIGINTTDIELYGEQYAGYIWAVVTHLSLYGVGGHIFGLPWWVLLVIAAVLCIGVAVYVRHVLTKRIPEAVLDLKRAARQSIRPLRYLLKSEYQQTPPKKLADLPLDAISGVSAEDLPKFKEIGIESIPQLADTNLIRERGKGPSDLKLRHGNSYAIDLMIHAEEPGIYKEIMPLEEILVQKYEMTSMAELPYLDTVAIEGVSDENAEKLRKANINLVKELAKADTDTIKSAGLTEMEATKFSECANWIMEYSKVKTGRPVMDNIIWIIQDKNLLLTFDVTKELGRSASGKTILVANSRGGRQLKRTDLYMSMIAFKYLEKKEVKPRKKREMQNITVTLEGNIAKLTIKRESDLDVSATGKSVIIASSRGNKQIEGTDVYFGLNVYRAKTPPKKPKKTLVPLSKTQ